jgi:trans-2,3-dihydro-3-hydroxyanthranilate isomerase
MTTYHFHQLDVFTTTPLAGNPLAVFPDARGLDAPTMQALAREMNLSETTFVFPSAAATRHVRFFTPAAEIPLAGHPTIGTWWALAELGLLRGLPTSGVHRVTQETGRGVLPVDIELHDGRPTSVEMTQAPPEWGAVVSDRAALARALGGGPDLLADGPPPQVVSTALPQLMVPVRARAALAALPGGGMGGELTALLRALGTDCAMLYAAGATAGVSVHCRMFAPGLGVAEDPATGSAAGALGAYLVRHGVAVPAQGEARLTLEQGVEIGRPSRIAVRVRCGTSGDIAEVRVGGAAVRVITGDVTL